MARNFINLALSVLFLGTVSALDERSAREQPCFNISSDQLQPLDLNWVSSIKNFYFPLVSRLELYRVAEDLLRENMSTIPESSLYYESCIRWSMFQNGTIVSKGFNGLSREYRTNVLSPNFEKFELIPAEGTGYSGTVYNTMTDNSTFIFQAFCTNDGEMAWGLGSLTETLPKDTLETVREHAISLGFKKEYFTELRYTGCNFDEEPDVIEDVTEIVTSSPTTVPS